MMGPGLPLFRAMMVRAVLLLSLLLSGMVPSGMMRQAGSDGMQLVLCTSDGPQEVWLSDDGTVTPIGDSGDDGTGHDHGGTPHCVQVNLATQDATPPMARQIATRLLPVDFSISTHQVLHRQLAGSAHRSRAPPVIA